MSSPETKSTGYDEDLAHIHDAGFGGYARGVAPGLLEAMSQAGITGGTVVDLGCGSGIWAAQLASKGYEVVGVDHSPAMIELARKRAPGATFEVGSFRKFKFPECGVITAMGEVVCYLFDKGNGPKALEDLAQRAFAALQPGGLFVFDVAEIGLDRNRPPTFIKSDDWACLTRFEYDEGRDRLSRHITTFRQVGRHYRRHSETHVLQLYDARAVAALLRESGFKVRRVRRLGGYSLHHGRMGFVARKP